MKQFCRLWTDNLTFMLGMKSDPSVLLVKFADLVNEPDKVIESLARFAGIQQMRREVLNHKVNTWVANEGVGISHPGYIEPVALTETEKDNR